MVLGVVIPTLNEAEWLPLLLDDLAKLDIPTQVVVADGGSGDGTPDLARERGALVVHAPLGRATQLNAGVGRLDTPWLLFVHADTRLPGRACTVLRNWLAGADESAVGVFQFALEDEGAYWRFIELGQQLRQRWYGLPYGDQGLVISRTLFDRVGGYPEQPLMEDVEIIRRLKRIGRIETLPARLVSSARRYRRQGPLYGWLRNATLVGLYLLGVSPTRLARWYRSEPAPDSKPTLLVFAKLPVPGQVKTRLAKDIGEERAASVARGLGVRVVRQITGGPYQVVICFDPPGREAEVRAWLGVAGAAYEAQVTGDLGARLAAAFAHAFACGAGPVCAIGTDAPGVDQELLRRAFAALRRCDLVLGPATDGGYYLIGLSRQASPIFHDIPWSTADVLRATGRRARALGLTVVELEPLSDVDTAQDLRVMS